MICPVRNANSTTSHRINLYVTRLETQGHRVHWPARDTKQDGDQIGIRICRDNLEAMCKADEVHVWFDPESRGSIFDLGMVWSIFRFGARRIARIQVTCANPQDTEQAPPSPERTLLRYLWANNLDDTRENLSQLMRVSENMNQLWQNTHVIIGKRPSDDVLACGHFHATTWIDPPSDPVSLATFGVLFRTMSEIPRQVSIAKDVVVAPTPEKSFANLLLWLVEETRDGPKIV